MNYIETMRVLLVEDEADLVRSMRKGLSEQSYAVDVAMTGAAALERVATNPYDAIVLDVMIPPPDGIEVCRRLRDGGVTSPIMMLTARDAVDDRIRGLDSGADDYLVKPFEFAELLARLRALIRRGGAKQMPVIEIDSLRIDTRSRRVARDGREIPLTAKEYALLEYMAANAGRVIGREEIAEHVWNEEFDAFSNLIEVYVNRLRRAIGREMIHTVRGAGYRLEPK